MPLGAMITRRDIWLKAYGSYQTFALHSSTFSGGSLASPRAWRRSGSCATARRWFTPPPVAASFARVSRRSPAPARSSERSGATA